MISIQALGAAITAANHTSIAAAIGGGTTAAQVAALGDLLTIFSRRPDLLQPALQLSGTAKFGITTMAKKNAG